MTHAAPWSSGHHDALATRRVRWGAGAVSSLRDDLADVGVRRAFVLTTPPLEDTVALTVANALGAMHAGGFAGVAAHVPAAAVAEAVAAVRGADADAIVSVGGGSVLDAAKAVVVAVLGDDGRRLRHVAVPTTLSGAEYAHFYGVTENGFKQSFADPVAVPELVILDPAATETTPRELWIGSAFKALDHAVETLRAPGERPIADPLALLGIREMVSALEASDAPGASDARLQCQVAAWHCYFAPANATLGLSHRIGHILGGTYGVPHAATSSITLPAVLRATQGQRPELEARIANALQPSDGRPGGPAADVLTHLARRLGQPVRLAEVGVGTADLPRIAALLRERYPDSVAELGPADDQLDALLSALV
jgi:alcohol dehydrogenase class IV